MPTDIKLGDYEVTVEGFRLKLAGPDFVIDHPERRGTAGTSNPNRRALVHGQGDTLIVNFGHDYTGGTQVTGKLTVGANITSTGADFLLDAPSRRKATGGYRRALVHDFNDGLTLNWAGDYPGGVTINGRVNCPNGLTVGSYDVQQTIASLLQRVATLESKVR